MGAIALLWLLWLGVVALFGLAVRGYLVEVREGMRISRARVFTLAGLCLAATVLVLWTTLVPSEPTAAIAVEQRQTVQNSVPAQNRGQVQAVQSDLDRLAQQLKQNQEQERTLEATRTALLSSQQADNNKLKALGVSTPLFETVVHSYEKVDDRSRIELGLAALIAMILAGVMILAVGGQIQSLFPGGLPLLGVRSEDEEALRLRLDELASLVDAAKYREALDKAASISENKLRPFDQLDLLYLRAFASVQLVASPTPDESEDQRQSLLDKAIADLEFVTQQAPKREEATYTLGFAYACGSKPTYEEALRAFELAGPLLDPSMKETLNYNKSVCCMRLAEENLTRGDTNQAEAYFARAANLGQRGDSVAQARLRIGMIDLRSAVNRQDLAAASAALAKLEGLPNMSNEHRTQVEVICSALDARLALRRDDPQAALKECEEFLTAHLPPALPELSDDTADETFSPVLEADLPFATGVFQGFLFIDAVARSKIEANRRTRPTQAQVEKLAEPLLRALQFVPRQRDLLGALGGLYYWFRRDKLDRARDWLEAAVAMGAGGRLIRSILERDRMVEIERGNALDWFRSASSRFLRDPALASEVRRALVEELGRFQEFEPTLISLREKPELEQEEPTLQGLRDRAAYLAELLTSIRASDHSDRFARLAQIQAEFNACLKNLESNTQTISALERRAFAELADTLVMR
jgi:hypothetical protein